MSWIKLHGFAEGDEMFVNLDGTCLVCKCPAGGTSLHFHFGVMLQVRESVNQIAPFLQPAEPIPPGVIPS